MKTSTIAGLVAVTLGMGMTISGDANASTLGYCGPENQGQTKEIVYYHSNGKVSQYWQFTCNGGQWEESAHWVCDSRGQCTNLS